MAADFAKMLDELMGRNRNALGVEEASIKYTDDNVRIVCYGVVRFHRLPTPNKVLALVTIAHQQPKN